MPITLIQGPMYSGKTTQLIGYAIRAMYAKKNVIMIKFSGDTRYDDDDIVTHNNIKLDSKFDNVSTIVLDKDELNKLVFQNNSYIFIDEGQFFDDIDIIVKEWAKTNHVYIAALNSDYNAIPWNSISNIGPVEHIDNLSAICDCTSEAHFTKKITNNNDRIVIGGTETYVAVCRKCFYS